MSSPLDEDVDVDAYEMDDVKRVMGRVLPLAKALMAGLRAVAPMSLATLSFKLVCYLIGYHRHLIFYRKSKLLTMLNLGMVAETLFALACAREKMRAEARNPDCRLPTREERTQLFFRCLRDTKDPQRFAQRWLRDCDLNEIRRGNLEDFLAWGMIGKRVSELDDDEREEMEYYRLAYEEKIGRHVPDGHNGQIRCYMLDHEPIEAIPKPLVYYGIVHGLLQRVYGPASLYFKGFGWMKRAGSFNYWVCRASEANTSKEKGSPIVLLHGIGVGLPPYMGLLKDLQAAIAARGVPRDIMVIELPAISQHAFPNKFLSHIFVEDIVKVLDKEQFGPACFIGHSYGTFCIAWILKNAAKRIKSVAFLEPGAFLIHHAVTVRQIVYKDSLTDIDELFYYFLRSELFFNCHLRRELTWQDNDLSFDEIPPHVPALIVLCSKDDMMPIEGIQELHRRSKGVSHIRIDVIPDLVHGGVIFADERPRVVSDILDL